MYQPHAYTQSILIVHAAMVEAELQRHHPERELRYREPGRRGPLVAVRRAAGRGLIALGTRLNPAAGDQPADPARLGARA